MPLRLSGRMNPVARNTVPYAGAPLLMPVIAKRFPSFLLAALTSLAWLGRAAAQDAAPPLPGALSPSEQDIVDASVRAELAATGVPAISIALVRDGRLAYARAYGEADLERHQPAKPSTRFAIGSVSKQLTAAAVLRLVEQGKLSLEDRVSRFLPDLRRSDEVTVRQLLSHTSGYQDYFEQEFIPAEKQRPTTVAHILQTWAVDIPLDFDPGTKWQYSGTNYVILGRIVEIVSGLPFYTFLDRNVLRPVGITDAVLADGSPPTGSDDAQGYLRYGLGPPHPAPRIGENWLYAMAGLSMTAQDVARWDLSVLNASLLSHASCQIMATEVETTEGKPTGYALGFFIGKFTGGDGKVHTLLRHPGEESGFRAQNYLVPDTKTALVILTNAEYSDASSDLVRRLDTMLGMAPAAAVVAEEPQEKRVQTLLEELGRGSVDRSQLTKNASDVFTPQALSDIRETLLGLGPLKSVALTSGSLRGGMTHYAFTIKYAMRTLQVAEYDLPDGKIEQFMIDQAASE